MILRPRDILRGGGPGHRFGPFDVFGVGSDFGPYPPLGVRDIRYAVDNYAHDCFGKSVKKWVLEVLQLCPCGPPSTKRVFWRFSSFFVVFGVFGPPNLDNYRNEFEKSSIFVVFGLFKIRGGSRGFEGGGPSHRFDVLTVLGWGQKTSHVVRTLENRKSGGQKQGEG